MLLVTAVTAGLITVSAASGLNEPAAATVGLAALAGLAAAGLGWWEKRAASPLLDLPMLASGGLARGLAGALFAYMVLFGPLVLFPQVMSASGGNPLRTGLVLAALPAGFGLAAIAAERVLPAGWPDRRRCTAGGILGAGSAAALAIPAAPAVVALLLGLLGAGLGAYIPANNHAIVAAAPPGRPGTAGGLVNMARGLGTALGVAAVSLALHTAANPALAMLMLAGAALAATWAGHAGGAGGSHARRGGRQP